jgi:putative transcriptional regulator
VQPRVGPGTFLVASPVLRDPNFSRTVVLLCEHEDSEGSMGLVINRPTDTPLDRAVDGVASKPRQVLWYGGPVQRDIVVVLHQDVDLPGARSVCDGMAVGGDPDEILVLLGGPRRSRTRVFSGYSGWGAGQLRDELASGSWIVAPAAARIVFDVEPASIWAEALQTLGPRYAYLAALPLDPRVN